MSPNRPTSAVTSILTAGANRDVVLQVLDLLQQPDVLRLSHTSHALRQIALRHPNRYAAVFFPDDLGGEKPRDDEAVDFCDVLDDMDAHSTRMSVTVACDAFTEEDSFASTLVLTRLKASMDRIVGLDLGLQSNLVNLLVDAVQHAPVLRSLHIFIQRSTTPAPNAQGQPGLDFKLLFGETCSAPRLKHLSIVCENRGFRVPAGNKLASLPRLETLHLRGRAKKGTWPTDWKKALRYAASSIPSIVVELNGAVRRRVDIEPLLRNLRGPWHVAMPDTCLADAHLHIESTDGAFRRRLMWGSKVTNELVGRITEQLGHRGIAPKVASLDVEPGYIIEMEKEDVVFQNLSQLTFHSVGLCEPPRTPDALDETFLHDVDGCTRHDKVIVAERLFKSGSPAVINFWCPRCGEQTSGSDATATPGPSE